MAETTSFTYPQSEHLKKRSEFGLVLKKGNVLKLCQAKMHGLPNDGRPSRMGLVVGKKFGNAPQRNRIKRLLKEAFRHQRHEFKPSMDVVVKVFPGFSPKGIEDLKQNFMELNQCCAGSSSDL